MRGKKVDLTGKRFGRLFVIGEAGRSGGGNVMWLCRCDCGAEVTVIDDNLKRGKTKSCGCYSRDRSSERMAKRNTTHGMTKTHIFNVWNGMLARTGIYKGASREAKRNYIDRNITVCKEWESFENFRDWSLSHGYSEGLQIDRIDNDGGYEPSNCRWVTRKVNLNNRRNTIRLEDGTSLAMFCSEIGIQTHENGRISRQYNRICLMYRRHHKAHPELLAKANETILLYRKCVELRKLLDEARQLKQTLNKP